MSARRATRSPGCAASPSMPSNVHARVQRRRRDVAVELEPRRRARLRRAARRRGGCRRPRSPPMDCSSIARVDGLAGTSRARRRRRSAREHRGGDQHRSTATKHRRTLSADARSTPIARSRSREALDDDIEHRNEREVEERRRDHAAGDRRARPSGAPRGRRRSRTTSGMTPRMNASDVIRIGRSRMRAASTAASAIDQPARAQLLGELDDQNAVLRRQADQHHEPDLAVDVVDEPAPPLREQRAEDRERHRQQDDERQREALVLRPPASGRRAAGRGRRSPPTGVPALISSSDSPDHANVMPCGSTRSDSCSIDLQRLARAVAGRRRPVDRRRSEQVVVRDRLRRGRLAHRDHVAERHHLPGRRPHVVALDVRRRSTGTGCRPARRRGTTGC